MQFKCANGLPALRIEATPADFEPPVTPNESYAPGGESGSCSTSHVRRAKDWLRSMTSMRRSLLLLGLTCLLMPAPAVAQGLTGALIGTVRDDQGGVLPGAIVRVKSAALIGGPVTVVRQS